MFGLQAIGISTLLENAFVYQIAVQILYLFFFNIDLVLRVSKKDKMNLLLTNSDIKRYYPTVL